VKNNFQKPTIFSWWCCEAKTAKLEVLKLKLFAKVI